MSTDDKAMRERFLAFAASAKIGIPCCRGCGKKAPYSVFDTDAIAFAQSELASALQTREPAHGLASKVMPEELDQAEEWLRDMVEDTSTVDWRPQLIINELAKLRATISEMTLQLNRAVIERDESRAENLKWQSEHTALKLDYHNIEVEVARQTGVAKSWIDDAARIKSDAAKYRHSIAVALGLMVDECTLDPGQDDLEHAAKRLRGEVERLARENEALKAQPTDAAAINHAYEVLRANLPVGHDGDEESNQCDENCARCAFDGAMAHIEAAHPAPQPAEIPRQCPSVSDEGLRCQGAVGHEGEHQTDDIDHEACSDCGRSFGDLAEMADTGLCVDCSSKRESQPADSATRTWFQCATTADEAVDPEEGYGFNTAEDAESHLSEDEHVYQLVITATKGPTP